MKIQLKGQSKDELYCEITDALNEYILGSYKKLKMSSYICIYDTETLPIRVPGATRGNIKLDGSKIKQFNLYEDTSFSKGLGCYDINRKAELLDKLNEFIGSEFE